MHKIPARAAYAEADAEVFPVEAQMTAFVPRSIAFEMATVIPRSLNDPVGFAPSFLTKISQPRPIRSLNRGDSVNGVFPSPNEMIGASGETGRRSRYNSMTPALLCEFVIVECI